jgi:hypothetical protein
MIQKQRLRRQRQKIPKRNNQRRVNRELQQTIGTCWQTKQSKNITTAPRGCKGFGTANEKQGH